MMSSVRLRRSVEHMPQQFVAAARGLIVGQLVVGIRHRSTFLSRPLILERRYASPLNQFAVISDNAFADISHPPRVSQPISVIEILSLTLHLTVKINNYIVQDRRYTGSKTISICYLFNKFSGIL
jgi:hypothetical protein